MNEKFKIQSKHNICLKAGHKSCSCLACGQEYFQITFRWIMPIFTIRLKHHLFFGKHKREKRKRFITIHNIFMRAITNSLAIEIETGDEGIRKSAKISHGT